LNLGVTYPVLLAGLLYLGSGVGLALATAVGHSLGVVRPEAIGGTDTPRNPAGTSLIATSYPPPLAVSPKWQPPQGRRTRWLEEGRFELSVPHEERFCEQTSSTLPAVNRVGSSGAWNWRALRPSLGAVPPRTSAGR